MNIILIDIFNIRKIKCTDYMYQTWEHLQTKFDSNSKTIVKKVHNNNRATEVRCIFLFKTCFKDKEMWYDYQ